VKSLNLPAYAFQTRQEGDHHEILDEIRRKWLVLTPEEWVRQHVLMYLVHDRGYPASLMEVEKGLQVGKTAKRADIVISSTQGKPIMIVECKAPEIKLNQEVMDQAGRYNITLKVPFLLISNGLQHFCCALQKGTWSFLDEIPTWNVLNPS
jgi:hypothetical protein